MEFIPNNILKHILSFLEYEDLVRSMQVCTSWYNMVQEFKKKIIKGVRLNIKKYVLQGNMQVIKYCGKIPFEARYKIMNWAVKIANEEIIQYAFQNDYFIDRDYTYFGNQHKILYNLRPIIGRNPYMNDYFKSFDNNLHALFYAFEVNDLEMVKLLIKEYDIFCGYSILFLQIEIAEKIFRTSDRIRDYVLTHIECNNDLICMAASYGMIDYLESHLHENEKYRKCLLDGIIAGANEKVMAIYYDVVAPMIINNEHRQLFINPEKIATNKSDYISFYWKIFQIMNISAETLILSIDFLLINNDSQIKNDLIYFMVDYLQNELRSSPREIHMQHIYQCHMDLVRYFFGLGCRFEIEDLKDCLRYNRIDILSFLNEKEIPINYGEIVSSIKYNHTVNFDTIKWLYINNFIDKNNQLVIKRILKMMDLNVFKLFHENEMIPVNIYEIIIHFCYSKTDIYDYLYDHGYRFDVDTIQQKFAADSDSKWVNYIFIKWFHQHGMPLNDSLMNAFERDDNIGPKWLAKRLSKNKLL